MGALTVAESLAAEANALADGWTEERLVDAAGEALGNAIGRFFPQAGTIVAYLGKGHNAADGLVALGVLRDRYGWKVGARCACRMEDFAPLTLVKWRELGLHAALATTPVNDSGGPFVLLDSLLGTGASGALRKEFVPLAREMAELRRRFGARVAAVDLPSGIDADTGHCAGEAVVADVTFMIANAKRGLLAGHAASITGALALVPMDALTENGEGDISLISPQTLDCGKGHRPFDFHKGMAGRVAIVAGSATYSGAAVLAATGALRGGAGLVTLFVPADAHAMISCKCPPEIIVRSYDRPREVMATRFDALVLGCGMGNIKGKDAEDLLDAILESQSPVVIDADALNLIASSGKLPLLTENHVVTPHPGEFAKLVPDLASLPREEAAREFTRRSPATLLLKGSRTIVTRQGQALRCNSTGTPGMASGGQGDLLAGVIGARLAIGDSSIDAASLSAWLCGRAAEIAMTGRACSEEALAAGDVARFLGAAFKDWKSGGR